MWWCMNFRYLKILKVSVQKNKFKNTISFSPIHWIGILFLLQDFIFIISIQHFVGSSILNHWKCGRREIEEGGRETEAEEGRWLDILQFEQMLPFGEIHWPTLTNTFSTLNKYILPFGEIRLAILRIEGGGASEAEEGRWCFSQLNESPPLLWRSSHSLLLTDFTVDQVHRMIWFIQKCHGLSGPPSVPILIRTCETLGTFLVFTKKS